MSRTKAFVWRLIIAVCAVLIIFFLGPLALDLIEMPLSGKLEVFLKACIGILALIYIAFGPDNPPAPF